MTAIRLSDRDDINVSYRRSRELAYQIRDLRIMKANAENSYVIIRDLLVSGAIAQEHVAAQNKCMGDLHATVEAYSRSIDSAVLSLGLIALEDFL